MTVVRWVAARGPEESRYRVHAEEPDAVGTFMCGRPPEGTNTTEPLSADAVCEVCDFLASRTGQLLAKEGIALQARRSLNDSA